MTAARSFLQLLVVLILAPVAASAQSGASATATVSNGGVVGLSVTQAGSGYVYRPLVMLSGGGGSGATALAVIQGGSVTSIQVTTPGAGYSSQPAVTVAAPGDTFDQGLVAAYDFNGDLTDYSGNGLAGALHGPSFVPDRFGNPFSALYFNGQGQYAVMDAGLPDMQSATASLWVAPADLNPGFLFMDGDASAGHDFFGSADAGFNFTVRANYSEVETVWMPPVGQWAHCVMVADAAHLKLEVWVNGRLMAAGPWEPGTLGASVGYHSPLTLGVRSVYLDYPWHGTMDELRIYDRALTQGEVVGLYERQLGVVTPIQASLTAVQVTMALAPGLQYQLQASRDLTNWTPAGLPFSPSNAVTTQTVPLTNTAGFWRVMPAQ